jgi:hypothetical protein
MGRLSAMKRLGGIALLGVLLLLSGCAGTSSYSSPESLASAYVTAGGECADPQDIPEAMLSEGAHGVLCAQPLAVLIVFDSSEAKNRYLARTGDSGMISYGGDRWLASGESRDVVSKLGGAEVAR